MIEEEMVGARLEPGRVSGAVRYYWKSGALRGAAKLDLFTLLGEAHLPAEEIAGL